MRRLTFLLIPLAAGLAAFFVGGAPSAPTQESLGRDADESLYHSADQSADREPPMPAALSSPRRDAVRRAGTDAGTPSGAAQAKAPTLPTRISVLIEPARPLDTTPPLGLLRVRAVSLKSNETFHGGAVASDGTAEIQVPAGGRYRVEVDPQSVPPGYVASGKFRLGAIDESGVAGAHVEVRDGAEVFALLKLFGTSSLSGLVTGPDGVPLEGAVVRAEGLAPGMAGLAHDEITGDEGEFTIHGLLPFVYGVQVVDPGPRAGGLDGAPQPARQLFDLRYGPYAGLHLALGSGPITVAGRVVDELGAAFANVSVRGYYIGDENHGVALTFQRSYSWSDHAFLTRTDGAGRFRVKGLSRVPLRIQVGAGEAKNGISRRAKFVPPPVEVDLRHGSYEVVQAGAIELSRSRRFVVTGRIELAKAAYPELRLKHSRIELEGRAYERPPEVPKRPGAESRPFVSYDRATGAFTISCDTPQDECTLVVSLRGRPGVTKEFSFVPLPDQTLAEQTLSFP